MSRFIDVLSAGPALTVQDAGRPGYLAFGLSPGGAADRLALAEGAALLRQPTLAALEMAGFGGVFAFAADARIALSGAPMRATLDGAALIWNASHPVRAGQRLTIGAAEAGVYGYLSVGGGIAVPELLGSRAAHLTAGLGRPVAAGDRLPLGSDKTAGETGLVLASGGHAGGGAVRVLPTAQTGMFAAGDRARFEATDFRRDGPGNRQGVRLTGGAPFATDGQRSLLSEIVQPGDIQMIGEGVPYVLMAECQTMGGYPRIATVVPDDLPVVAQAAPGDLLRFRFVSYDEALADYRRRRPEGRLAIAVRRLLRDPREIADLLGHQLISGVTDGRAEGEE